MSKIAKVVCKCGGVTLAMLTDDGSIAFVKCPCGKAKRNTILEVLRREHGWSIPASMFDQKPKYDTTRKLLAGKFKSEEALDRGYRHLCRHLGISEKDADRLAQKHGTEGAYIRLQSGMGRMIKG